ncbi:Bacterial extracellular solute-binding protein [Acididesulfobacillus acetoxydans]|uniref:Bacterial extracellular solute-binding protein n=1 Tax=Acididesulfobacillus acetoxydans TaxID=1561005 RepID=A0A8S0W5J7_9FIRM|nr:ABC transporter substrate-binding protein [Acididesulfobacillus acetoxydans]CAA7603218.1 Bacterial extracellular solute-binding protein [Acididesulfobacillus acetoxydans]
MKVNRKVKTLSAFAAAALALSLAGCGTAQNPNTASNTGGPVTISFAETMVSGTQKGALDHLISEFESQHSNIKITLMPEPNYGVLQQKEVAAVAAKNPPTIGQVYEDWAADFAKSGAIIPLDSYIQGKDGFSQQEIADFVPTIWKDQQLPDGKTWMLPFNKSDFVMYYNADKIKQLNKTAPQTWQDFASVAKAAASSANNTWGLTIDPGTPTAPANGTYLWISMLRSNGGHLYANGKIAFNSAQGVQTMRFFKDLYSAGALKLGSNYPGETALGAQRSVFDMSTVASYPYVVHAVNKKFDLKVAAMPSGSAGQGNIMQGTNIAIFSQTSTAQKQAAWQFIKFLTEPQQTAYWAQQTGYLPIRTSALPLMKAYLDSHPYQKIAADSLQYAKAQPPVPGMQQAVGYIGDAITRVLTQNVSAQQALDQAASKAQQALASAQ